jgi:PhnB protein
MQVNTYLIFNGQCEQAFKFYEKCIGAKIQFMMTHGESPMAAHVTPEWRSKIIHGTLGIGEQVVMGSDAPPDHYEKPQGFSVSIEVKDPAEAERMFAALAEGGKISMAMQETFWATRFGMLVDQFGIPWMVNCAKPMQSA